MNVRSHQAFASSVLQQRRHRAVAASTAISLLATALAVTPIAAAGRVRSQPPNPQTTKPGELGYEDTPVIPGQKWKVHDVNRPAPPLVTPGATPGAPPSDAVVLFDGKDLSKWAQRGPNGESIDTEVAGARRLLRDRREERLDVHARELRRHAAARRVGRAGGGDGHSQGRGNSGVILMGRYEVQVLDMLQQPHLRRRRRRLALRPVAAAGERAAPARRVADLRHRLRGAALRRGQAGDAGVRDRALERRARHSTGRSWSARRRTAPSRSTRRTPPELPLTLQDHGNPVRYRNVWARKLTLVR